MAEEFIKVGSQKVKITNPNKILFPKAKLTKQDFIYMYEGILLHEIGHIIHGSDETKADSFIAHNGTIHQVNGFIAFLNLHLNQLRKILMPHSDEHLAQLFAADPHPFPIDRINYIEKIKNERFGTNTPLLA